MHVNKIQKLKHQWGNWLKWKLLFDQCCCGKASDDPMLRTAEVLKPHLWFTPTMPGINIHPLGSRRSVWKRHCSYKNWSFPFKSLILSVWLLPKIQDHPWYITVQKMVHIKCHFPFAPMNHIVKIRI